MLSRCSSNRSALFNVISADSFLVGRTKIVPLVARSHGNVRLGSDEPAGAADNSDVAAAAILQASSFGSACGSSSSSAQVRQSRPSCSLLVARVHWHRRCRLGSLASRSSVQVVHTAPGYLCPCRHSQLSQAVKQLWFGLTLIQYLVTVAENQLVTEYGNQQEDPWPAADHLMATIRSRR